IPSNGVPMARYEEARAEIAAHGGVEVPPAQQSQGFLAWLFGGGNGQGDSAAPAASHAPVAMAYANNTEGDEASSERPPAAAPKAPEAQASPQPQAAPRAEVAAAEPASAFDGAVPLPPRRPLVLASADDLPLPPVRPAAQAGFRLASLEDEPVPAPIPRPTVVPDAIGGLIAAPDTEASAGRKAALPEIITQGTARDVPAPVLAFASAESIANVRPAPEAQGNAHAAPSPKALGLRGVAGLRGELRSAKRVGLLATASREAAPSILSGPAIYGLRRAALAPVTAASL
ncbi:MAG: hypothetical protein P4L76_12625, partial [Beijerinckiaceae bacterium]|nr:hypothetical protein [Beijerinckiaceae bacterium]